MDTVNKFVQLIKLVQREVGRGSEHVRPPRLVLAGAERTAALDTLKAALAKRPKLQRHGRLARAVRMTFLKTKETHGRDARATILNYET